MAAARQLKNTKALSDEARELGLTPEELKERRAEEARTRAFFAKERKRAEAFLEKQGLEPFRRNDLYEWLLSIWSPFYGQRSGAAERRAAEFIEEWRKAGKLMKAGRIHWRSTLSVTQGAKSSAAPKGKLNVANFKRKTRGGRVLKELGENVQLTLTTRVPDKWAIVDLETGERYIGTPKGLERMTPKYELELQRELATK